MAYTASIAIAVKGIEDVKALQAKIEEAAKGVDRFNNYAKEAFGGDYVRSIRNLNAALRDAADAFDKAALGTSRAADAASAYLAANRAVTQGLQDRKRLLQEVAAAEAAQAAAASGMKFSFGGPKALPAAGQTAFKGEVSGGLGGGARAALRDYEMLVDAAGKLAARTQDAADMALRHAAATKQQVPALNHFAQIYQGIYSSAVQLSQVKALPSSEMLNAEARGLQTIESINKKIAKTEEERLARLERIRKKILANEAAYAKAEGRKQLPPATAPGMFGKLAAKPGMADAIIGGAFPALFGGGAGAIGGGFLGGLAGGAMGGPWGMALSLGLSAAGMKADELVQKFADIQAAAKTLNVDDLRDSVLFVNSQFDLQIDRLVRLGELDKARLAIQQEIASQTGVGVGTQNDIENSFAMLKKSGEDLVGSLGGLLSTIQAPFNVFLSLVVEGLAQVVTWINQAASLIGDFIKSIPGLKDLGEAFKMPNEELEKANAALDKELEKMIKQLNLNKENLRLEEQRTLGRTAAEKAINAELDKQQQINKINADYEQKIIDFRLEHKKARQDEVEKGVKALEALKEQEIKQLNITASLQEQVLALDKINERYNLQNQLIDNAQARLDIQVLEAQLAGQITEQKAQELLTTNELFAVQEKIIAAQNQLKDMRPLLTESDIALAEGRILALQKQEIKLKLTLQAQEVQRIKDEFTRSVAEGLRAPVRLVIDGQQLITSLKNAEAIIQSTLGVVNARYAAEKAINDLLIQRAEQEGDTERVYELRVRQVELTYRQTVAQIRAEVEQARIKLLQVQLEYQKFDIQMRQIMLLRQLTQEERLAWQNQYDMLQLLKEQYNLMVQAAEYRMKEADAIRQMTLEQLAYNRAKEAGNASGGGGSAFGKSYIRRLDNFTAYADGGYIDKPTMAVMGEGGQSEFVIPENKMQTAMQRYAAGKRGADVIPDNATDITGGTTSSSPAPGANNIRGGASISPQINVTTGPVLELNNKRYVSQDDMVQSLRVSTDKAVEATLKLLQTNTRVRKSLGIA